jgi:hypothetical protein
MSDQEVEQGVFCYSCNKPLDLRAGEKVGRREECPRCMTLLHCCHMCQFFAHEAYNSCREPNAERILDKERTNFCGYFALRAGESDEKSAANSLQDAAASLFKS